MQLLSVQNPCGKYAGVNEETSRFPLTFLALLVVGGTGKKGLGTEAAKVLRTVQLRPRHPATVKEKGELLIKNVLWSLLWLGKREEGTGSYRFFVRGVCVQGTDTAGTTACRRRKGKKTCVHLGRRKRRKEEIASH